MKDLFMKDSFYEGIIYDESIFMNDSFYDGFIYKSIMKDSLFMKDLLFMKDRLLHSPRDRCVPEVVQKN